MGLVGGLAGLTLLAGAGAVAGELPQEGSAVHEGVYTCQSAGGPCHGSIAPTGTVVRQNEYSTWSKHDEHAQAYKVLLEDQSQRIARNLGLEAPAHESPLCLNCHADFVPEKRRGEHFALEDGVGCEACHGGSKDWLTSHTREDHAENVAKGLYPTDDPKARAELCVSCHFGNRDKFVTHRIMGAGHPRMSFELDTFTHIQPRHYDVDQDYASRGKKAAEPVKVWAIGQAVIVREVADALLDSKRARDGIWPELVLYDCHACHHRMSKKRWSARPNTGLDTTPGVPRLNDSSFLMLHAALEAVDPASAEELRRQAIALHLALSRGDGNPKKAAKRVRSIAADAIPRLEAWQVSPADIRTIAENLVQDGLNGHFRDYAGAEQAAMALQALVATLHELRDIDAAQLAALQAEIDQLLVVAENDERYQPAAIKPVLRNLESGLR